MYKDAHIPRKFLVIIDGTIESKSALRWAERRARCNGGTLVLLMITEMGDLDHWLGVRNLMQEDAHEFANKVLKDLSREVKEISGHEAETYIRQGSKIEQIQALIEEDKAISSLVLATSSNVGNPGPLVSVLMEGKLSVRIPVTIIPGHLTNDEIDALT